MQGKLVHTDTNQIENVFTASCVAEKQEIYFKIVAARGRPHLEIVDMATCEKEIVGTKKPQ